MKTILFFDRCDLTDLYVSIGVFLKDKLNVIHVAFSDEEKQKLHTAGITDYIDYQELLNRNIETIPIDESIIQEIDRTIISASEGRFNLNSSIQSDRGFSILSYSEALLLAQSHYLAWKEIFSKQRVDIMYHEICSQFMVHIAALLCKSQGGIYRDTIQCASDNEGYWYLNVDGENFRCQEIEQKYSYYKEHPNMIDKKRSQSFLETYRKDYSVFFGSEIKSKVSYARLLFYAVRSWLVRTVKLTNYDRIKDNITYWLISTNTNARKLKNLYDYWSCGVKFITNIPEGETYYYYSFHLEPEATVLYLGDGIYQNQVKLIQNIAASLPAGTYLYVKDHPHEYAYRDACDYERLMNVPNIRLIHQSIPGKKLIANARGIFSINGTACFEALLLGKQVYCFGNSYYSCQERVNVIKNIRDIRDIVYSLQNEVYSDDDNLYAFVTAYLESSHLGYTDFFCGRQNTLGIDILQNGLTMAEDLTKELEITD